ncbi:hypothetical protein [Vagococcus hydrophili]|uniref:DUF2975 domain-containing protein n=1 Tax=Vagococcus hydrophili TaxID=2714947 RepID=A0A6G8ATB1_9ENTE|nr:hypothetical protein [Vagococcus hydrophili]QIL48175.1 hypothetical protein G7082_06565 [Vagococcus hydrophili]
MKVKNFKRLSRVLEAIFKVQSIIVGLMAVFIVIGLITGMKQDVVKSLNLSVDGINLFSGGGGKGHLANSDHYLALCVSGFFKRGVQSYILWQAGIFFSIMRYEKQPFTLTVYRLLRKIGIMLIAVDIIAPLIYYIIINVLMTSGYQIVIGTFTAQSVIGLVIYFMAEVIRYGITLQKFTNDVV